MFYFDILSYSDSTVAVAEQTSSVTSSVVQKNER
jgi:hypothetical protein